MARQFVGCVQEWGGASSRVLSVAFYGDAPSPPLLAHFPEPTLRQLFARVLKVVGMIRPGFSFLVLVIGDPL